MGKRKHRTKKERDRLAAHSAERMQNFNRRKELRSLGVESESCEAEAERQVPFTSIQEQLPSRGHSPGRYAIDPDCRSNALLLVREILDKQLAPPSHPVRLFQSNKPSNRARKILEQHLKT